MCVAVCVEVCVEVCVSKYVAAVKTRRGQRAGVSLRGDLCYGSWSLSHLGYLYTGTTPVMIKLDHGVVPGYK